MGWYTNIIIIAESIESKESSIKISEQIFTKDSKSYEQETLFISQTNSIYYTYERRKCIPHWIIKDISNSYPNVSFTVLISMPDICGPSGIIRFKNGKIIDSYGIYGENSKRQLILDSPIDKRLFIYEWYKIGGMEQKLRTNFLDKFPLGWCEEKYSKKIIPITEEDFNNLDKIEQNKSFWEIQPNFDYTIKY